MDDKFFKRNPISSIINDSDVLDDHDDYNNVHVYVKHLFQIKNFSLSQKWIFISCSNKKVIYDSIIIIYMQAVLEAIRENGRGSVCV